MSECTLLPELKLKIYGVSITLWDSPGLQDIDKTKDIIGEITAKCKENEIDLYVYCVNMTQVRVDAGEFDSIKALTGALGENFWNHSLFAMTYSNAVEVPKGSMETLQDFFEARLYHWEILLKEALRQAKVSEIIAKEVPVVPCSYRNIRLAVPTKGADWFATFWETCVVRMRFKSIPALLTVHHEYTDENFGKIASEVIAKRLGNNGLQEDSELIVSLLECSLPEEVSQQLPDIIRRQRRQKFLNTALLFLGSCAAAAAMAFTT